MEQDNPSIMSHVSVGTRDLARAVAFYDAVLPVLGCAKLFEFPGAVAYGKAFPEFWVQTPIDGKEPTVGNGVHFCFIAESKEGRRRRRRCRPRAPGLFRAASTRGARRR